MKTSFKSFLKGAATEQISESTITESTENSWHKGKSDFHKQAANFFRAGGDSDRAGFHEMQATYHEGMSKLP